jgi:hypothetical protein
MATASLHFSFRPSLDLVDETAAALGSPFKEAFLQGVGGLIESLLPEDLVFVDSGTDFFDSCGGSAVQASDHCLGIIEFPGLRELCASALRANGADATNGNC